jgi:hypothetical protein
MVVTKAQLNLVPRTAWILNSAGAAIFLGLLIGLMVTGVRSFLAVAGSAIAVAYLLGMAVVLVRPPSVRVYDDHLVIARVGRSRIIKRKDFCSVGLQQSQRVVGGDSNDSTRHVFISYYDCGSLITVPAIWCDRWMGLLTQPEWQRFNAVLTAWAKGEKVVS